jgi:hypothetical protein
MGKGALLRRRAHQARGFGGHAEPVIGPAEGRTRWLCPPYGASIRPERALILWRQQYA